MRKKITIILIGILLLSLNVSVNSSVIKNDITTNITLYNNDDFDPLVDISVTVEIQRIRSMEKDDPQVSFKEEIDKNTDPDFYIKVFINDVEFQSDVWSGFTPRTLHGGR